MGRTGVVVTGLVALALIIGGVIVLKDNNENQNTQSPSSSQTPSSDTSNTTTEQGTVTVVITYDGNLFSPSQVTVKKGDTITIKNESSTTVQIQSNVHPIHTDNEELNIGEIAAGQSKSFTVNKVGSWGYHNHLDPTQTGTIVVR